MPCRWQPLAIILSPARNVQFLLKVFLFKTSLTAQIYYVNVILVYGVTLLKFYILCKYILAFLVYKITNKFDKIQ